MFIRNLFLLLLFAVGSANANVYYIASNGGTAAQCNGTVNASVASSPNCAWAGPMVAFGSAGESGSGASPSLVASGDTVFVEPGQYQVGFGSPGATGAGCNINWPYDCVMNPIPAGTSTTPTQLIGVLDSKGKPPQFWGNDRASEIINMMNSSYVVVSNLEITNHVACIYNHPTNPCPRSAPYAAYADNGIFIYNATGVTLKNLNIHNLANSGIQAGSLNNFSMNNVVLRANGWSGFNNDVSGRNLKSSNSGNITFANVLIAYNGCGEQYPSTTIYGCFGQQSGGYGDGLGAAGTGGNWVIIDSKAEYNTQDGFDLLYADGTGSVSFIRDLSVGNAGNQFKAGGGTVKIEDSVGIGNCATMQGQYNMQGNNSGGGSTSGDLCRALGNTVAIAGMPGKTVTIQDNTFTTQGNCQVIMAGNSTGGNVVLANNIFIGNEQYQSAGTQSCTFYDSGSAPAAVKFISNIEYANKLPAQQGSISVNPLLTNQTLAGFNAIPLAGSPAIGKAATAYCTSYDFSNAKRSAPCDIGAYKYSGIAPPPPVQTAWCWQSPTLTSTPIQITCP
jgi:hypothetical protein